MIYLTYNDAPSGVYFSQVTDVCSFIKKEQGCPIRLVAFISGRNFSANRKKIKARMQDAIVLPMFPRISNWRKNRILLKGLFLLIGKQNIWARGPFAANIALELKKSGWCRKVVFDGRGAYKAEFEEYLGKTLVLEDKVELLEKQALEGADLRLAVSGKLVEYWQSVYGYKQPDHVIVPCTINASHATEFPAEAALQERRKVHDFAAEDIVFVFSGSAADWQSFELLDSCLLDAFSSDPRLKLVILSQAPTEHLRIRQIYGSRVSQQWLKPEAVQDLLLACDIGLLLREDTVTNRVASPTKFAEYLDAGLDILISAQVGDFTGFVREKKCGRVAGGPGSPDTFSRPDYEQRLQNHKLCRTYFTKAAHAAAYRRILNTLAEDSK
jgi:hypothetical protein